MVSETKSDPLSLEFYHPNIILTVRNTKGEIQTFELAGSEYKQVCKMIESSQGKILSAIDMDYDPEWDFYNRRLYPSKTNSYKSKGEDIDEMEDIEDIEDIEDREEVLYMGDI